MTREQFISSEVATWGSDYIFDLLDQGYEPVELVASGGRTKWTWIMPLTHARDRSKTLA